MRPTKSIVIGGGQPIVIPGQTNITNDPKIRQQLIGQMTATTSRPPQPAQPSPVAAKPAAAGFMASLFGAKTEVQEAIPVAQLNRLSITEHKVISVDEFCPDGGGGLDRGFLDDEPSQTSGSSKPGGIDESDTDDDTGNPMVARFHDEPGELDTTSPLHMLSNNVSLATSSQPKVNPLAKVRSKNGSRSIDAGATIRLDYFEERKSSLSSEDIEVPIVLTNNVGPGESERFDSWISSDEMTSRRRSPEGGEDVSALTGAQPDPVVRIEPLEVEKVRKLRSIIQFYLFINFVFLVRKTAQKQVQKRAQGVTGGA